MDYEFRSYKIPKEYFEPKLKVKELRVGNWVESYLLFLSGLPDSQPEVKPLRQLQVSLEEMKIIESPLSTYQSILISPEVLGMCGFEALSSAWYEINDFKILLYWDEKKGYSFNYAPNELVLSTSYKYLHQLQNIYFWITGEELQYSPTK